MLDRYASRRTFFKQSASFAAPLIVPASAVGRDSSPPSERITCGMVGAGGRGMYLLDELLAVDEVRVVGVCDVHAAHYRDNAWGKGRMLGREGAREAVRRAYGRTDRLTVTNDYREICGDERIDTVFIATPDHWHALCALEAIRRGKDVYCEKPVTHTFAEGRLVRDALQGTNVVFQTGSQQRSDPLFRKAVELVRNGHLGVVQRIEIGLPPGYASPQGDATISEPPRGLDYDMWSGPAALLPYMRARHHRWWRGHRAYGGGVLMDWIGHHNDIAHWSLDSDRLGPQSVEAIGWQFPATGIYNTPRNYEIRCQYHGNVATSISSKHAMGTKWIGEDGWLHVDRGKLRASDERWLAANFDPGPQRVFASPGHMENFLDCVRSRATCVAPAETAHRSITPGFLGYISHQLARPLRWDPVAETILHDAPANKLLHANPYRAPWTASGEPAQAAE